MKKENIELLIQRINTEISTTQVGLERDQSLDRLKDIAEKYRGEDMIVSFHEIAEQIKKQKDELKIFSGWRDLDGLLGGFRLQQVVVVSALTKSGKTSFLMDLTTRIREHNPLWFPFEESAEELIRKFIERNQPVPRAFTPQSLRGSAFDWIESKIIESIAKYNTRVVFIDQLDFIVEMSSDNHALRIGHAMRTLKGLAKKWNIVIFIICHLAKAKMDFQPTMEDLKGSSSIGQEADTVILLWREMRKEHGQVIISNNVNVSVQANRRTGKTGNVKMVYEDGKFIEREWTEDAQLAKNSFEDYNGL